MPHLTLSAAGAALLALALTIPLADGASAQVRTKDSDRPDDFGQELDTQIGGIFSLYSRQIDEIEANAQALRAVDAATEALGACGDGRCVASVYRALARDMTAIGALEGNFRFKFEQFDMTARGLEGKRSHRRKALFDFSEMLDNARRSNRGRAEALLLDRLEDFNGRAGAQAAS